jgi:hypothetical protein
VRAKPATRWGRVVALRQGSAAITMDLPHTAPGRPAKERASPAEAEEADRTGTFRQTTAAPKGPQLVGIWSRRSISTAARGRHSGSRLTTSRGVRALDDADPWTGRVMGWRHRSGFVVMKPKPHPFNFSRAGGQPAVGAGFTLAP